MFDVLTPQNVDIILHIPLDELIFVRHSLRCNTIFFTILTMWTKIVHNASGQQPLHCLHCYRVGNTLKCGKAFLGPFERMIAVKKGQK